MLYSYLCFAFLVRLCLKVFLMFVVFTDAWRLVLLLGCIQRLPALDTPLWNEVFLVCFAWHMRDLAAVIQSTINCTGGGMPLCLRSSGCSLTSLALPWLLWILGCMFHLNLCLVFLCLCIEVFLVFMVFIDALGLRAGEDALRLSKIICRGPQS